VAAAPSGKTYKGVRAIVELLAGAALGKRIAALPSVIKIFFRYWVPN
jgi:hypothetical protein